MVLGFNQEGVAIEVVEAVIGALKGELAATAVNATMVPAEVSSRLFLSPLCIVTKLKALLH